jgi:hypothetical protein
MPTMTNERGEKGVPNPGADKLRALDVTNPDLDPELVEFGRIVAGYIRPGFEMNPRDFFFAVLMSVDDLVKGVNGATGEPVESSLIDKPQLFPSLLSDATARLAAVAYGEEFGSGVQEIIDTVTL